MNALGKWNIVIVGSWNTKIFSIPWVSRKLFGEAEVRGEFSILPGFPMKYSAEDVELLPDDERLTFQANVPSDEVLQRIETKATDTLRLLPETPIRAVGANFLFQERAPSDDLHRLFQLPDAQQLVDNGFAFTEIIINRRAPMNGGFMNLALAMVAGGVRVNINYHCDVQEGAAAAQFLNGNVVSFKNRAVGLLAEVYDLHLEEA